MGHLYMYMYEVRNAHGLRMASKLNPCKERVGGWSVSDLALQARNRSALPGTWASCGTARQTLRWSHAPHTASCRRTCSEEGTKVKDTHAWSRDTQHAITRLQQYSELVASTRHVNDESEILSK